MITVDQEGAGFPVRWTTTSWINAKPCFLIAAAVLFPVLIALSLPRSQPYTGLAASYRSGGLGRLSSRPETRRLDV